MTSTTPDPGATDPLALAQRLRLGAEVLRRTIRQSRTLPGLSRAQEAALNLLERKGDVSIADLARMEQVRPQSMRITVASLVEASLVRKEPDPTDGRRELVSLTEEGRRAVDDMAAQRSQDLARLFEQQLNEGERATIASFLDILERLATVPG